MALLTLLLPIGAGVTSGVLQKAAPAAPRFSWLSLATALLVAAMLALQLRYPGLLAYCARSPALLAQGQVWRALTALFVQDGGLAGGLFNLVLLAAIGPLAERRLGPGRWAIAYFGGGIATEFAALAWQPDGAGNSIACLALAGSLAMAGIGRGRGWLSAAAAAAGSIGALMLLVRQDIHGIGFLAGIAIGTAFALRDRERRPRG